MKFTYHKIYVFEVYKREYQSRERGMSPVDLEVQESLECIGEWVCMGPSRHSVPERERALRTYWRKAKL